MVEPRTAQFRPRTDQSRVVAYQGGLMGVAAVPGSGKTSVLSALAARLVASQVDEGQEVLVVTLVNAAVDNFTARIRRFLRDERQLLPGFGYRVRTLHGLAHDIVRERPGLVGLADDFAIADDREAGTLLRDLVQSLLRTHSGILESYFDPAIGAPRTGHIARIKWPEQMCDVTSAFIRRAKDRQWSPELLRSWMVSQERDWPLLRFCIEAYSDYERSLSYRGKVDFDDLVKHAISALRLDNDYLDRLRRRWPFVLEDEAQDSSELQQDLLALLVGPNGSWVRVGDANQAIYQTFTTADPRLLREFLQRPGVQTVEMWQSGRSARSIVELANHLVDWTVDGHPLPEARSAFRRQHIELTALGDPQPNPPQDQCQVHFHARPLSPGAEVRTVVSSIARWLPDHQQCTVAILVPDNERGVQFANALAGKGLPYLELLNSSTPTRESAAILERALQHLADPDSPKRLADAFLSWSWRRGSDRDPQIRVVADQLRRCEQVEDYLWPRLGLRWPGVKGEVPNEQTERLLAEFRGVAQRWHQACALPIDQLLLTLGQDLFGEPSDLARTYQFAVSLRDYSDANPHWRVRELARELGVIARNARRFAGTSAEDTGFDPDRYQGKVIVATMHRAKGLEWDRVHVTAVNNYDFPSGAEQERYRGEPWYVRGDLNLVAEALGQLAALSPGGLAYQEGDASRQSRLEYIRERLRLLYVGITRARRELIVTWNTGKREADPKQPALAFNVLRTYWEAHLNVMEHGTDESRISHDAA